MNGRGEAPDSKDTATFLRRARAASLKAIGSRLGSRFGALAEEEYDKIAPVIACTLPALTDPIPERKRRELAGEVTSELQVVGKAASTAIQTWMRNNDKTKARAEEREKNIGWIKRLFTAWRVSHAERTERRAERRETGEDDPERRGGRTSGNPVVSRRARTHRCTRRGPQRRHHQ